MEIEPSLVVILCAGSSSRMGNLGDYPSKVLLPLKPNCSVLQENIKRFREVGLERILVVVPSSLRNIFEDHLSSIKSSSISIVDGGATRTESVRKAINYANNSLNTKFSSYVIHDGARPFFPAEFLRGYIKESLESNIGIILGMPCTNTIKEIGEDGFVKRTLDRNLLWEIQTPQIFPRAILELAYNHFEFCNEFFDDASLLENLSYRVKIVKGSYANFKITTKSDLLRLGIGVE